MKLIEVTLAPTIVLSDFIPTAVGGTTGKDVPTEDRGKLIHLQEEY